MFCHLAAAWLDKQLPAITEEDRERTNRLVDALMYGAGKNKLSSILSVTEQLAGAIMSSFYA